MTTLRAALDAESRRQNFAWGHVAADRWEAVRRYAGPCVLDVGCSNGVYVRRLAAEGYRPVGVDMLEAPGWAGAGARFALADARALPFPDGSFDTVISFETLEHVPGPERALREYHRVCRRNVVLSVPNCETPAELRDAGLTFHHWVDRTHTNFWTFESFAVAVEGAGFRVAYAAPINRALPALPFLRSLGVPGWAAGWLARAARTVAPRAYALSLLVVGVKAPA